MSTRPPLGAEEKDIYGQNIWKISTQDGKKTNHVDDKEERSWRGYDFHAYYHSSNYYEDKKKMKCNYPSFIFAYLQILDYIHIHNLYQGQNRYH